MITIGLAFAQPVPIGFTKQWAPFESSPSSPTRTSTALYWAATTSMYDGDLTLVGYIRPAAATAPSPLWFQLSGFVTPYPEQFPVGWVDLKMKYDIVGGVDDMYRIEYQVGSSAWVPLVPDTTEGFSTGIRPWAQIAEPNDGVWDWADIGSINVRVTYTKVGTWQNTQLTMYIYEVWLSVYPAPLPPAGSPAVSVQPRAVSAAWNPGMTWTDNIFFVDVYVQDVLALAGYEFTMQYDNTLLMFLDAFGYWPWVDFLVTDDAAAGQTNVLATAEPPIVDVGFDGNSPMARLYFAVNWGAGGTCGLDLIVSKLGRPDATPITHSVYNGFYSHPYYLSFPGGIFPAYTDPTGSVWHEDYPTWSNTWTVTGWIDNGDGTLSPSDQLFIDDGSGLPEEYHVDQVTITIHWTFKAPASGEAAADPEDPAMTPEPPLSDPTWTRWHQIYPDYCRTFTITSWEDNTPGGYFDPSDQFDFEYDDEPGTTYWAHLDAITTNIWVSKKGGPVPEFPLGIGVLVSIVALVPVIYVWRTRPKKKVA